MLVPKFVADRVEYIQKCVNEERWDDIIPYLIPKLVNKEVVDNDDYVSMDIINNISVMLSIHMGTLNHAQYCSDLIPSFIEKSGKSKEELIKIAFKNAYTELQPYLWDLKEAEKKAEEEIVVLPSDNREEAEKIFEESLSKVAKNKMAYYLSTAQGTCGAGAVFYNGVVKRIAEFLDCNLMLVPRSIHGFVIYPIYNIDSFPSIEGVTEIIKMNIEMNKELPKEEFLDNRILFYFKNNDKWLTDEMYVEFVKRLEQGE